MECRIVFISINGKQHLASFQQILNFHVPIGPTGFVSSQSMNDRLAVSLMLTWRGFYGVYYLAEFEGILERFAIKISKCALFVGCKIMVTIRLVPVLEFEVGSDERSGRNLFFDEDDLSWLVFTWIKKFSWLWRRGNVGFDVLQMNC